MTGLVAIDKLLGARTQFQLPDGLTIAEMIEASRIEPMLLGDAEVWIEDIETQRTWLVPREKWPATRPKPNVNLVLRAYGGKGGSGEKSTLGIVLTIAVMVAAAAASWGVGALIGGVLGTVVGAIAGGVVGRAGPLYVGNSLERQVHQAVAPDEPTAIVADLDLAAGKSVIAREETIGPAPDQDDPQYPTIYKLWAGARSGWQVEELHRALFDQQIRALKAGKLAPGVGVGGDLHHAEISAGGIHFTTAPSRAWRGVAA